MVTYYLSDTAITALKYEQLATAAPAVLNEAQGWICDKKVSLASPYTPGTTQAYATFVTEPSAFSTKGYRTVDPVSGTIAAGNWVLAFKVKSNAYYAQKGYVKFKLWRSTSADGSGATQITDGWKASAQVGFTAANQYQTGTVTWAAGSAVTLASEYLFLEVEWYATVSGGNNSAAVSWVHNEGAAEKLVTPAFLISALDWAYSKSHVVGYAAGAGTNYQKRVVVHFGSGTDGGEDVYCSSHCKTDFGDVRFTSSDGASLLDYWLESKVDGDYAVFWVEVADSLESAAKTIYVYYGNAPASTTSDGDSTFLFFDHFPGSSIDTAKWNGGTVDTAVASSIMSHSKASGVYSWLTTVNSFGPAVRYRAYGQVYQVGGPSSEHRFGMLNGVTNTEGAFIWYNSNVTKFKKIAAKSGVSTNTDMAQALDVNWHIFQVLYASSASCKFQIDANAVEEITTNCPSVAIPICSTVYSNNATEAISKFDWVFISKYVSPEPAHGAWGSEEINPASPVADSIGLSDLLLVKKLAFLTDAIALADSIRSPEAGWNFYKSHIINAAGGAGTNYPIYIQVHYGSGTDSGSEVYLNGKCRTDFADVRFRDSVRFDYSYWLEEKVDGDYAKFWVKINEDLTSINRTVKLYYGKSTAASLSDGPNTFLFFGTNSIIGWTQSFDPVGGDAGIAPVTDLVTYYKMSGAHGYDVNCYFGKAITVSNATGYRVRAYRISAVSADEGVSTTPSCKLNTSNGNQTGNLLVASWAITNMAVDATSYNNDFTSASTTFTLMILGQTHDPQGQASAIQTLDFRFTNIIVQKYFASGPAHSTWGPEVPSNITYVTDLAGLSDLLFVPTRGKIVPENLYLADILFCNKLLTVVSDSSLLTDGMSVISRLKNVLETIVGSDLVLRNRVIELPETLTLGDLIFNNKPLVEVLEAVNLLDEMYKQRYLGVTDGLGLVDQKLLDKLILETGSVTLTEYIVALAGSILKLVDGSLYLNDEVFVHHYPLVVEAVSLADSLLFSKDLIAAEFLGLTDYILRDKTTFATDDFLLSDDVRKGLLVAILETLGLVDVEKLDKALDVIGDIVEATDSSLCTKLLTSLADTFSVSDLALIANKLIPMLDAASVTDDIFKINNVLVVDEATLADLTRTLLKSVQLSENIALVDSSEFPFKIRGVTYDEVGVAVGGVTLWLFTTNDKVFHRELTSDVNGNYLFDVLDNTITYFIVAFKAGSPNKVGTTYRDITGELET